MRRELAGVLVPLTTPFDSASGDVAAVSLRSNARALCDAGVSGIVAAGSTGESAMLSDTEWRKTVGWLRDVVPEDSWLVAGAGGESTRGTIQACQDGAVEGADAALIRPPVYFGSLLELPQLVDHYRNVADASPIPILVYNIPKYTHLALSDSLLAALVDHPNILGAKDSSGDLKNFAAYRDAAPKWALLVGSGALFYAALELGAVGGILGVANFAVATSVAIYSAFQTGDKSRAGAGQEVLTPLHKEIVAAYGPAGVKAAMEAVGLAGGPARPPLRDLEPRDRERVWTTLRNASLSPVSG